MPKNRSGQKPMNGVNTAMRASNLGGNNKKKKDNMAKYEKTKAQERAFKEKELADKKKAVEAKLIAKRIARAEALKLDIELGFLEPSGDGLEKISAERNEEEAEKEDDSAPVSSLPPNVFESIVVRPPRFESNESESMCLDESEVSVEEAAEVEHMLAMMAKNHDDDDALLQGARDLTLAIDMKTLDSPSISSIPTKMASHDDNIPKEKDFVLHSSPTDT